MSTQNNNTDASAAADKPAQPENDWQKEQRKEAERGDALLTEIVAALAGSKAIPAMKTDNYWHDPKLQTIDGYRVGLKFISYGAGKGRLAIRGQYSYFDENGLSDHRPYDVQMPEITVDPARGGAKIAKEIERRMLPGVRELVTKCRELKASRDAYKARVNANAERLREHGGGVFELAGEMLRPARGDFRAAKLWGEIRAGESDVEFKLHGVPMNVAERILQVFASIS